MPYFTCIGRSHGAPVVPATRADWEQARRDARLVEMCARIERGDDKLKHRLPVWTPLCAAFEGNHRAIKDARRPLPRLLIDIDQKHCSRQVMERLMPLDQARRWHVLLVEESVRRGTHVLLDMPPGLTVEEAQARFSEDIGLPVDGCTKDVSRCLYLVPEDHTLYASPDLFEPTASTAPSTPPTAPPKPSPEGEGLASASSSLPASSPSGGVEGAVGGADYDGIPYPLLVESLAQQLGGVSCHGARNNFLFSMACHLRYVCNDDPRWIAAVLPTYGEDPAKAQATIRSACNRPQSRTMPTLMQRAISVARHRADAEQGLHAIIGSTPPPMPRRLPPLIELLTRNVPLHYKPAVAHAVFPALGAHLGGVKFRYIDNVLREATFMCCLLAKMSSGKSAVNKPIEYILADIVARDDKNRHREQAWKDSLNTKGANKEKPRRPDDLCIQVLVSDMTNAAFVQRLKDAGGKFLYTCLDELELLDNLKTSSRGNQVSQIIRLAFDCGHYGQERVGSTSVTARVRVKWNWNASSTIQRGKQYFRNALADGTLSRINFCTIQPPAGGALPVYGTYTQAFADELAPYIARLNAAQGTVECPQAEKLARKLLAENAEVAGLSGDETYEVLSYRANVIAYLKAMTLYVAHGRWTRDIEEFVRWSEQYDLWCKMTFFGRRMQQEMEKENHITHYGPTNMLDMLPPRFSRQELIAVRRAQGKPENPDNMLANWKKRGYIEQDTATAEYIKTPKYLKRYGQSGQSVG